MARKKKDEDGANPETEVDGRDYRVEGNDTTHYVGTSPEYMTYANETEAPYVGTDEDAALQKAVQDHDDANASAAAYTGPTVSGDLAGGDGPPSEEGSNSSDVGEVPALHVTSIDENGDDRNEPGYEAADGSDDSDDDDPSGKTVANEGAAPA